MPGKCHLEKFGLGVVTVFHQAIASLLRALKPKKTYLPHKRKAMARRAAKRVMTPKRRQDHGGSKIWLDLQNVLGFGNFYFENECRHWRRRKVGHIPHLAPAARSQTISKLSNTQLMKGRKILARRMGKEEKTRESR